MPFVRLFVAVDLSDDARTAIASQQSRIAAAMAGSRSSLKWVKPDQAHLTLVFLGHVDAARADAVVDAMGRPVDLAPFDLALEGVGVFPPRGAPRVLWVGVGDGAPEVARLQHELASRAAALDIPLENRPFSPHLTIGRWRESVPRDRVRATAGGSRGVLARVPVRSATLYQSRLSPAGSSYTALTHANLTRPSA